MGDKALITAAAMRALEGAAMEAGAVSGAALMARAGAGAVEAMLARWPELARGPACAVILCGPGNNGGDGFVMARLLKARGWRIRLFFMGEMARLPPDAALNARRWGAAEAFEEAAILEAAAQVDIIIDALFGAGLTRPLCGKARALAGRLSAAQAPLVAVDAPSGLCMDSGRALGGVAVKAALTVSFHRYRPGHFLAEGPAHCGALALVDIGLEGGDCAAHLSGAPLAHMRRLQNAAHKYQRGHALIVSGGFGKSGAARLAARAALRAGAGLVTIASPPSALMENAAQLTAIMLRRMGDAEEIRELLEDARLNALVLGPGGGVGADMRALVEAALAPCAGRRGVILDADALTSFKEDPAALFALIQAQGAPHCLLTPHGGEFARLFPDLAARLTAPAAQGPAFSHLDAARAAAKRAGAHILFKGAASVIANPGGAAWINDAVYERAAPGLATAGSGDVLAGIIAGLFAAGADMEEAAAGGAWLHGCAGRALGLGLIAEDLPEALPGIWRELGS